MPTTVMSCRRKSDYRSIALFRPRGFPRRRGFTLTELLVVVSIIVLLVAMVLPFMGGVRERGYLTLCQNNLEKISQAMGTASSNLGGQLPTGSSWLAAVKTNASQEVLLCPKGHYRGGGGSVTLEGQVELIPSPQSSVFNTLEDNKIVWMFQEREAYDLPSTIDVDISQPGRYTNNRKTPGTVPAGTMVDCYFLHFDPIGGTNTTTNGQVITFTDEILGYVVHTPTLDSTDRILGSPGTVYSTGQGSRGFEGVEDVEISDDGKSFIIHHYQSTFPGEEVRILTKPGGLASYGINSKVGHSRPNPNQIYIVEYDCTQVNIDSPTWEGYIAHRHYGRSNALLVDGSVHLLSDEEFDPKTGEWLGQPTAP